MIQKPWLIIVIGVCYLIAPIANLMISVFLSGVPLSIYISTFKDIKEIVEFFFILPLAGIGVLAFRWWSYPIFTFAFVWSIYYNYKSYSYVPEHFPLALLIIFYIINFILISYFLFPTVRAPYFNKRLRWWESHPRYHKKIQTTVTYTENDNVKKSENTEIKNISVGGALLHTTDANLLKDIKNIELTFSVEGLDFNLTGEIVHLDSVGPNLIGVQFDDKNKKAEMKKLKNFIQALILLQTPHTRAVEMTWTAFFKWLKTAITTGKGILPEITAYKK